MTAPIPFEKHRFRAAARHYLQGRPAYASGLIRRLVQLAALGPQSRVMDLGCGPGQLALALAPFVGAVTAVDPEPEMLRLAEAGAAEQGLEIAIIEASSAEIGPQLGRFDLVVIGRAFHWMDRPRTLESLNEIILPGGAVALLHTRIPALPDNAWAKAYDALIDRYAAGDTARHQRKSPDWPAHEAVMLESPFCRIERIAVLERQRSCVESIVERALSLSSTSPEKIGARTADLAREMRQALTPFAEGDAAGGWIGEIVESEAIIAWRPET
jgi:SAM-dependent methyltransferase